MSDLKIVRTLILSFITLSSSRNSKKLAINWPISLKFNFSSILLLQCAFYSVKKKF